MLTQEQRDFVLLDLERHYNLAVSANDFFWAAKFRDLIDEIKAQVEQEVTLHAARLPVNLPPELADDDGVKAALAKGLMEAMAETTVEKEVTLHTAKFEGTDYRMDYDLGCMVPKEIGTHRKAAMQAVHGDSIDAESVKCPACGESGPRKAIWFGENECPQVCQTCGRMSRKAPAEAPASETRSPWTPGRKWI